MSRFTPTLRGRLSILYAGLFALAGVLLVVLSYLFVSRSLPDPGTQAQSLAGALSQLGRTPVRAADGSIAFETKDGRLLTAVELRAEAERIAREAVEQQRADTLRSLLQQSGIALALVATTALGAGWLVAGRALRPLQAITGTARRVADRTLYGDRSLHERIALDGPADELKVLADTFDEMLERLDRAFASQSRFVANASHELRTPLAVNRTLLEVAVADPAASADLRQVATSLLAVNERSERLIDGLLLLARSERAVPDPRPVDLAATGRHVVAMLGEEARRAEVVVRERCEPAVVLGDSVLLERVLTNLVDNAIRYNRPGGWVSVSTGRARDPAYGQVEVSNSGPVVAPHDVEQLFEPFRRGGGRTASVRGSGLGLSIVRSVVEAHGGTVAATARAGGGLAVRVTLPTPGGAVRYPTRAATAELPSGSGSMSGGG
ncbi:HAMP domain-containing sensor histidine kinase [Kribbella sp. HUAS MG21]|uniref:histidine kinase n=1 Tax=Kribbella sp. HUAS MG21 TaxID=3160966 RepID=A0AAU7T2Z2_9ACTN